MSHRDELTGTLGLRMVEALELVVLEIAADTRRQLHEFAEQTGRKLKHIMTVVENLRTEVATVQADEARALSLLAAAATAAAEQTALIASLKDQLAQGVDPATLIPLVDELHTNSANFEAALTPPVDTGGGDTGGGTPPATFVVKVAGETYADYVNRFDAWNADPANAESQQDLYSEENWNGVTPV